ncbi:hypothetical protein ABIB45_000692 [Arthrobacter sp. UYCo732]
MADGDLFTSGCAAVSWTDRSRAGQRSGQRRYALAASTVKNQDSVADRPRQQPLRSNSSSASVLHSEKRYGPTPRAAGISLVPHQPTLPSTPPGRSPLTTHQNSTHPLCAPHPHRRPQAKPRHNKRRPTSTTHVAPTAGRRPLKARCKRHPRQHAPSMGPPKTFWGKVRENAVASEGPPHTEEVAKKEPRAPSWGHRNACAWRSGMFEAVHMFYRQEGSARANPGFGRFGYFCSRFGAVKSPESA